MSEHGSMPFTMTIIILLVIILIFAMKYGAQWMRDRAEAARNTQADLKLSALDEKTRDLETRVSHLEAVLREVE